MNRLLREPLVHFLLLGGALFALLSLGDRGETRAGDDQIVVTAGHVETLVVTFTRTWQRPPTPDELKGLIDAFIEEEILNREALRLGMEREDTVIRRRLKQKMEFLYEDFAATATPTEEELREFYQRNVDAYRAAPRLTFRHVFLSERRGDDLDADARAVLAELRAGADPDAAGDATLLPRRFEDEPLRTIASQLGADFAQRLDEVDEIGVWHGPIGSPYGTHLVLVTERRAGAARTLEEVRPAVERDLVFERRQRTKQAMLDGLLERYEVTIEWPDAAPPPTETRPGDEP